MLYEILVYGRDNTHADPIKDARGCYKAGDIVLIRPAGKPWGESECQPIFYIFKVELTEKEAEDLMKPAYEKPEDPASDIIKRRRFKFDFNDPRFLPTSELDKIKNEDWYLPTIYKINIADKIL